MRARFPAVLVAFWALAAALGPRPTHAFAPWVPEALLPYVFVSDASWLQTTIDEAGPSDLDEVRRAVYLAAIALPDEALADAFRSRYPSESDFDAYAFKEFLILPDWRYSPMLEQ